MVSDCQQYAKLHVYLWAVCVFTDRWQACLLCLTLISSQTVSLVLYVHTEFKRPIPAATAARHLQEWKQQQAICKVADSGTIRGRIRNRNHGGITSCLATQKWHRTTLQSFVMFRTVAMHVFVIVLKHCPNTSGGTYWKNKRSFQCVVICHL